MKFRGEFKYQEADGTIKEGHSGVQTTRAEASYRMATDRLIIERCGGKWMAGKVIELREFHVA